VRFESLPLLEQQEPTVIVANVDGIGRGVLKTGRQLILEDQPAERIPSQRMVELYTGISITGHFGFYRFTSPDQCTMAVFKSGVGNLKTLKKVEGVKKVPVLQLSPLYTEARSAIFFGIRSEDMPLQINGSVMLHRECNNTTHLLKRECYYTAYWTEDQMLPFFEVGLCSMVDKLALTLGGIKTLVKDHPGKKDWLFQSKQDAKRHLLLCLIFFSGKSDYFLNLFRRAKKLLIGGAGTASSGESVVQVTTPTFPGSVLFFLVLQKNALGTNQTKESAKRSKRNNDDKWAVAIPNLALSRAGNDDFPYLSGASEAPMSLFADFWTWKIKHTIHIPGFTLPKLKKNRAKRKKSRRIPGNENDDMDSLHQI
jgi:hypothetical protein